MGSLRLPSGSCQCLEQMSISLIRRGVEYKKHYYRNLKTHIKINHNFQRIARHLLAWHSFRTIKEEKNADEYARQFC